MKDRTLIRYRSIAARAKALLDAPLHDLPPAPDAVRTLIADAVARLGPWVATMPGARGVPPAADPGDLEALDEPDETLGPVRRPRPPSRR